MAVPVPAVKIDWNANGNYSGTYDDITADVTSFSWQRGSQDWTSGSTVGGATIRVKNATGKYNPGNAGGVLYGNLLPGRPVHITAVYGGTTYGIFGGYIDRIIPLAGQGAREAELICVDAFSRWGKRSVYVDALFSANDTIGDVRAQVLTDLGAASPVIPAGEYVDAIPVLGLDYRAGTTALDELNRAVGTRHVIRPKATPTGSVGWDYFAVARTHRLSATVDETITNVQAVNGYEITADNIINAPNITYSLTTRDPNGAEQVIWSSSAVPFVLTSGMTVYMSPHFDRPYVDILLDYEAVFAGGNITETLVDAGTMARVSLASTGGGTQTVTRVTVTGRPTVDLTPTTVYVRDAASIAVYGWETGPTVDTPFMRTETMARGLGNWMLWRYATHRERPTITLAGSFPTILAREVFDIIALTIVDLSVSARRFEVTTLSGRCAPGGEWSLDMGLLEMTEQQGSLSTWFTLNTSVLNGTHKIAP